MAGRKLSRVEAKMLSRRTRQMTQVFAMIVAFVVFVGVTAAALPPSPILA